MTLPLIFHVTRALPLGPSSWRSGTIPADCGPPKPGQVVMVKMEADS